MQYGYTNSHRHSSMSEIASDEEEETEFSVQERCGERSKGQNHDAKPAQQRENYKLKLAKYHGL